MTSPSRQVPCGSCTACCRGELIILHPEDGDRASRYRTRRVPHPTTGRQVDALEQRSDGACTYLSDTGCTIYARRPAICRSFDCRRFLALVENGRLPIAAVLGNPILVAALALRQREQAASSGERPGALPLPDPDAPTVSAAGVSAPKAAQSRHLRSRPKPEATHA